ncbi:DUF2178 domain-containing protein [Halomicroarcula sp. F28]|uniref:DUF2178 domain-containing protein n=2 Tax=Haloarcula salinisoli TaxID=2487746 RepID=A0A8J7YKN8_9EURY|nr:DUF2178 domain-containing protein [Halomicroarcula salinisoli]MBX0302948.1 DUF2178 domain-containing protein [Halomicroarcula salinisoli]
MFGSILVGVAVALVLRNLGYPVVGEAVYWLGILAFFAIWKGTDIQLVDERDWELERRASLTAFQIIGAVAVVGFSAARLLTWLTDYTFAPMVQAMLQGAFYGLVGFVVAFGVSYLYHRSRL